MENEKKRTTRERGKKKRIEKEKELENERNIAGGGEEQRNRESGRYTRSYKTKTNKGRKPEWKK